MKGCCTACDRVKEDTLTAEAAAYANVPESEIVAVALSDFHETIEWKMADGRLYAKYGSRGCYPKPTLV
jgi:hypothetical protein